MVSIAVSVMCEPYILFPKQNLCALRTVLMAQQLIVLWESTCFILFCGGGRDIFSLHHHEAENRREMLLNGSNVPILSFSYIAQDH